MSSKLFPVLKLFDNSRAVSFSIHLQGNAETMLIELTLFRRRWPNVFSTLVFGWKLKVSPDMAMDLSTLTKQHGKIVHIIALMQRWWFCVSLSMSFCWKQQLSERIIIDETNVDRTILKQRWQYLLLWFCALDSRSIANLNYLFKNKAYMFLFWKKKIGIELESNYSVKELDRIYIKQKIVFV